MLTISLTTIGLISAGISIFIFGMILGGFFEWDKKEGTNDLRRQLRDSYRETEELREYIWLITAGTTTPPQVMKEGALPSTSVKVERSLRPINGEGRA
jgi:hypothetical protein